MAVAGTGTAIPVWRLTLRSRCINSHSTEHTRIRYWKERFPGGAEIRDYFNHLADVWDLRKDTVFDTLVTKVWHDGGRWTSTANSNILFTSKFVVAASGSSHKRYLPSWPGIQQYGGKIYHSASYPHEGLDVTNKAIAVGNGASGVQILQTLAKEDCQLTAFLVNRPSTC
ncbi:hypothetical protein AYO20_11052 [Fonsecaea nubica]|uniref:L-ornithine N(5)-oxygenase n=1 Tax=Fonsecaea nubica TaxID=856822 RepID=A0A178C142_9EURO|nr:hypothetical protein AYO20_11052 [Fonsecaea nubica]OAL23184.1 hypothetical protein AYO20_11052 [Fonsecaea nubica]